MMNTSNDIMQQIHQMIPLPIQQRVAIQKDLAYGLVIVDEVKGFAQPGAGNLAPPGL